MKLHIIKEQNYRKAMEIKQGLAADDTKSICGVLDGCEWLFSWCTEQKILFVNNWNLFWERPRLFRADGLHPSRVGAELLSDNITRTLRSYLTRKPILQ